MKSPEQLPQIVCDFTPPEVSMDAFKSYKTKESLADQLKNDPIVCALQEAYEKSDSLTEEELTRLESEAINSSAEKLRTCLQYSFGSKPWEEKPEGDCYAYTWLMSDITEKLKMKSMIAYCNGHAFNIIQGKSGSLHMINGESKHMWLYDLDNNPTARNSFSETTLESIKNLEAGQSVACSLRTDSLRYYSDNNQDYSKKVTLPWLEDSFPAAKIMPASEGKKALFAYTCLEQAVVRGDIKEVFTALSGISDCNPQFETREKLNPELRQFKKLIKKWAADKEVPTEDIVTTISMYQSVMPETKSMVTMVGDCMRTVGQMRRDLPSLEMADQMYEKAEKRYSHKRDKTLEGKRRKLRNIFSSHQRELIGASV